jgi:ABC-2 type transport system permease protein
LTTVLSKLLLAVVIAPLITLGIGIVLSLVLVLAACFMLLSHGTNLFGALLSSPDFYLTPLRMIGLLPVYILWALPTVGWLLMVSSMVRSS